MVVFRVTENVNIKTTDGTLVKYLKLRNPANLLNNSLYITTYGDMQKLEGVLKKVGPEYQIKVLKENKVNKLKNFPVELGVSNKYEYSNISSFNQNIKQNKMWTPSKEVCFLNEKYVDLKTQLQQFEKQEIKIVLLGNVGAKIGEMVASLSALRLLHESLSTQFKSVIIDVYIEASDNSFFTRDRDILLTQTYISNVYPLSLSVKQLCEYDFYIDNSSIQKQHFYKTLNYVDAFLYKFGMEYKKIPSGKKHNQIDIRTSKVRKDLITKLEALKEKGKLLLFHPYSSSSKRSFPKEEAQSFLKKLIKRCDDYTIVSALQIDNIKAANYANLTAYSKNINDFMFIISQMDKIITTDTSTYHISDAFFIPTVVFCNSHENAKKTQYYNFVKTIHIKDESMNFSKFKFDEDSLVLYKFESWKKIKFKEVMKLLETI